MKGFKNRLMIVLILIIIGSVAPHLGAVEMSPAQYLLSQAIASGHCDIRELQLEVENPDPLFVAFWIGFADKYGLNLEILKAGCVMAVKNTEENYKAMGEIVVSRETF